MGFKPHFGQCKKCPPGTSFLIPTKRGLCQKHLYEFKQQGKAERKGMTVEQMEKAGQVKKAADMDTDYKALADKLFSEWIRRRRADVNGFAMCITCGLRKHWKQLTCGHFMKRRFLGTRFNDKNCEAQCWTCNPESESNPELEKKFERVLVSRHGIPVLDELNYMKNTMTKFSQNDYREICEDIRQKIDSL